MAPTTRLPSLGSRVSIRYRQPAESRTPLTDVIGHLEGLVPLILVRTKSGDLVTIAPDDVMSIRELSAVPLRASEIRALESAAALAWPGTEQDWYDGWLLRAGGGHTHRANSAVPLDFSAAWTALPAILDWYADRGLPPWLTLPDRMLPLRAVGAEVGIKKTRTMVSELVAGVSKEHGAESVALLDRPNSEWLALYERDVPEDVLTAVVDGEVVFATVAGAAVGRGAVTAAPDGTGWLGISAVNVVDALRRRGHARAVCAALQAWGVARNAQRVYVQVLEDNFAAITLYESLGFRLHHHHRYIDARLLDGRTL